MSTDPNFPKRDAPKLPDEASADETHLPEGEVVSGASKASESNGAKANGARSNGALSEDEIKKHDPEKFGSFTLPPDFLKEALSQPLPKAKEEDLAHDTLAPYRKGGEVHRQVLEKGSAYPDTVEPITVPAGPRAKMASRAEGERAGSRKNYMPVLVIGGLIAGFAIGGMFGIFERQDGEVEIEGTTPTDDGSAESKTSAKPSASEQRNPAVIEEPGEGSEGDENPRADAPRPSASNGSSTVKADSSKGVGVAATPKSQPKSQQAPDPDESEKASSEKVDPSPQPAGSKAPATIPVYDLK